MDLRIFELLKEIQSIVLRKSSSRWLTIKQTCEYTSLSHSTIRRAVNIGALKASKTTGKLLFKVSAVDRWLNG